MFKQTSLGGKKSDLLNTFSSQIETMPSLLKQSRYSTREGIKL